MAPSKRGRRPSLRPAEPPGAPGMDGGVDRDEPQLRPKRWKPRRGLGRTSSRGGDRVESDPCRRPSIRGTALSGALVQWKPNGSAAPPICWSGRREGGAHSSVARRSAAVREALGSAAPEPELELKRRLREAESAGERPGGWGWGDGVRREDGSVGLRGPGRGDPGRRVSGRPCLLGGPGPARGSRGAGPGPHSQSRALRHLPGVAATAAQNPAGAGREVRRSCPTLAGERRGGGGGGGRGPGGLRKRSHGAAPARGVGAMTARGRGLRLWRRRGPSGAEVAAARSPACLPACLRGRRSLADA